MKQLLILIAFFFIGTAAFAQSPVTWTFSSKKTGDNQYEVYLTATIQSGWHLYSQVQPKDAIAIPTAFTFNKNPLLSLDGKVKEIGKLEKYHDKTLDVSANQYSQQVVFVQKVKVKGKARTNVAGKLEFQTCDDKKCLPPKTVNFSIALL
ncbi:MAG TPA: protein-disulfide reductase DsbD domain-containing protein [Chitinophagaceae bacterium]|jgi:thiol:disulfide interchange protein DsbD|nr:protein-disulfide reductase DsbD domain-containing protein [Chitinophagaceae bacterium]